MPSSQQPSSPSRNPNSESGPSPYQNQGSPYPNYGYGGSPYGQETEGQSFNLKDILFVIRERFLLIFIIFILSFAAVVIFTFTRPEMYRANASIEVLRTGSRILQVEEVMEQRIAGAEDFNTQVSIFNSGTIISRVVNRLTPDERTRLMSPYGGATALVNEGTIIGRNRSIIPQRQSLIIGVEFRHQDPALAARIANYFVEEFIDHKRQIRLDESFRAVEELRERAEQQRLRVEELERRLADYHEEIQTVSLDERNDIVNERLRSLNQLLTTYENELEHHRIRVEQIDRELERGSSLLSLSFIGREPTVAELHQKRVSASITINQLSERYRDGHPRMIEARRNLRETEDELSLAIESAVSKIRFEKEAAETNLQTLRNSLQQQQEEVIRMARLAVDYNNIRRSKDDAEIIYNYLLRRISETNLNTAVESVNVVPLDRAVAPVEPFSPRVKLFLGIGMVGGLGLGVGLAFFVALIDDRIKSAYDIENVLGLSLLGVIPEAKRVKSEVERSQIALTNADPMAGEAIRSLHSSIKFHKLTSTAQCIVVTSILPNEGKTFVSSNLALSFSENGEKTVLIDCDLRNPSIATDMGLENSLGVTDYCYGQRGLDEIIRTSAISNLDVITSGQQRKNPTQILNSEAFSELLVALRKRYQRIIIDSPPLGPVRDSLIILPHTDGAIFVIRFGEARRKEAKVITQDVFQSEVPVFGAVLNNVDPTFSGHYHGQYYHSSYQDYYLDRQKKKPVLKKEESS